MNYSILFLFPLLSFIPTIVHAQGIIPNQDGTDTVVHQQGNQFNIQGGSRSSNNANLFHSFQEFNLNQGQTANFISTPTIKNILGRINGGNPSMINGLIQVTGGNSNLFLMNPAGIIFGANASLNLPASFHVSTATGIGFDNNQWFQSVGNNNYENLVSIPNKFIFANTQPGTIINQGKLHLTDKQSLSLLGGSVINTGELSTTGGNITIASVPGENIVKISQVGHLLSLELSPFANVSQSPQIEPVALPQLLTGNISDNQANTITINQFGQVVLGNTNFGINDINQTTINTGKIDISQSNNGISSQVNIIGNKVGLIGGEINASGYNQGGTVLIGGDFQGQGIIPNAWQTYVSQDSIINADAINNGNGGKVIIWSDNQTNFQGSITARGGVNSGNGGLVEISGKKELIFNGKVDVSAINGLPGTVLFDPDNLTLEKSNSSDDAVSDSENKIINDTDDQSSEPVNKSTNLEKSNVTESEEGENIGETAVTKETKTVDKTDSSEANVTLIDGGKTENIGPVVKVANKKDTERTKQTASDSQTKISDKPATAKPTTGNKPQTSTKKPTTTVKTPTNPTNKSNENTAQAKTSPDKTVNDQEKLSVATKVTDPFAPDKSNNIVINSDNVNKLDINKLDVAGNIELKANNDLTVNQAIATDKSLKLVAGRSININADIDTSKGNGNIGIFANDRGVEKTKRQSGPANILQADNTVLNAGAGNITIQMGNLGEVGDIKLGNLTTTGLLAIQGAGANINQVSANSLFKADQISLENSGNSGIGSESSPLRIEAKNLEAVSGNQGIFLDALSNITIGGVSEQITGIQATGGGKINLKTNSNLKVNEDISTYVDGDINAGDITIKSTGNIDSSLAKINAGSFNGDAGDISIESQGSIITGDVTSVSGDLTYNGIGGIESYRGSSGSSGNISLNSKIYTDTSKGQVVSRSVLGNAGNITIESQGDIRTANIKSLAGLVISEWDKITVGEGLSGNLKISSKQGLIETVGGIIKSSSNNKNYSPLISLNADDDLKIGSIDNVFGQTSLTAENIISALGEMYSINSQNLNVSASNDIKLSLVYTGEAKITSSNGNIEFVNLSSSDDYSELGGITVSSSRNIKGGSLYSNNGKISITSGELVEIDYISSSSTNTTGDSTSSTGYSTTYSGDNAPFSHDIVVNAKQDIKTKQIQTSNSSDSTNAYYGSGYSLPTEWLSGDIILSSTNGAITVENLLRTNAVIKSGDINLIAKGDIKVNGNIFTNLTNITPFPEIDVISLKSTGGNVNLTSQNGSIYVQDINTGMYSAGQVNINAYDEIVTGNINTQGMQKGGDVNLISETASIDTSFGKIETTATLESGINGKINIQSPADISVGAINTSQNLTIIGDGGDNFNTKEPEANIQADADRLKEKSGEILLEAHNDINLEEAIQSSNISRLELKAGRNINIKANIDTSGSNGDIVLQGNTVTSRPDLRETGTGSITMASGTKLNAGSGNISLALGDAGPTGNITVGNLQTTGLVSINSKGGNILANDQNSIITSGNLLLNSLDKAGIGTRKLPLSIKADNVEASTGAKGLFLNVLSPVNIGNVNDQTLGIKTIGGGDININVAGNLTISEPINTSSLDTDAGNIFLSSQGNIKFNQIPDLYTTILDSSSNQGNGGDIQVTATGNINSIINSLSYGYEADSSSRSNNSQAGDIIFQAGENIDVNSLNTSDRIRMMGSNSVTGDISVTSKNGNIKFRELSTFTKLNTTGNIKVKAKKNIQGNYVSTMSGGIAGNVTLISELGKINVSDINTSSNVSLPAGNINIKARQDIKIDRIGYNLTFLRMDGEILSQTGSNINITSDQGNIYLYDLVSVGELAGDINLKAKGNILFRNINAQGKQKGGDIQLISQKGTIRQFVNTSDSNIINGLLTASTEGEGGNILVDGYRGIDLNYADSSGKTTGGNITLFSEQGNIKILSTNTQSTSNNQAGNLSMESVNGNIITGGIEATNLLIDETDNFLTESGLVSLKAHNDVTINKPIITKKITDLEIEAGRNININADIDTSASNGNINLLANSDSVDANLRGAGTGNIIMAPSTNIKAGKGNITIAIGNYGFNPDLYNINSYNGNIILNNITTDGNLSINSRAGNIFRQSPNALLKANQIKLNASQIGSPETPLRLHSNTLQALGQRSLYIDAPQSGINFKHFEQQNIESDSFDDVLFAMEEIRVTAQNDINSFGGMAGLANPPKVYFESREGDINFSKGSLSGQNITLIAPGDIYTESISSYNYNMPSNAILTINSKKGEIDTTAGSLSGVNLIFEAFGDIRTGFINGSNIDIISKQGSINTTFGQLEYGNELQVNPLEDINNVVLNLNMRGTANITGRDYSENISNIDLEAKDDVTTNSIVSTVPMNSSNINITSHIGNINTDAIISLAESGRSGNITLNAPQGNINTNHLYTFTNQQSGNININAGGKFNTGEATINTGGIAFQGIGGNVSIKTGGDVLIGGDIHRYGVRTEGREGGGNINIEASGKINITGDLNSYSERNQAGNIILDGAKGVTTSNILSDGPLASGNVSIRSASGSILTNNIKTIAPNGVSGNINLNTIQRQGNIESANISTIGQNLAGEIKIRANDGSIKTENLTSSASDGTAGGIEIEGNDITTADQTVNSPKGSGTIKNKAKNNIQTGDLTVSAEDYALIKQLAGDSISTGNIKVESQSGDASNQQQAGQNIQTGNISISAGNNAENVQKAGGDLNTGNIDITAGNNAINNQQAGGNINTGNINITAGNDGINQQKAGGNVTTGDINITAGNNAINNIQAGGTINTGSIELNAPHVKNSIQAEKPILSPINNFEPVTNRKLESPVLNSTVFNTVFPPILPSASNNLVNDIKTNTEQPSLVRVSDTTKQLFPSIKTNSPNSFNNPNTLNSFSISENRLNNSNIFSQISQLPNPNTVPNIINYQQSANNSSISNLNTSHKDQNLSDLSDHLPAQILTINSSLDIASNSQLLKDIESDRNQEFSKYWRTDLADQIIDLESIRNILGTIRQQTGTNPAVVYINAYTDSLQIILYTASGEPVLRTIPITRQAILKVAQELQANITHPRQRNTKKYLTQAQQLYQWLIKPIEDTLQANQIDTLLFSLDQGLRSLPMATLHDGQQFFVEKYSSSIIPSISLMNTKYEANKQQSLLAMGISEFVTLPRLPGVPIELNTITDVINPSQEFLNEKATYENLLSSKAEYPYRIIHLATHAEFLPGDTANSYIQMWDGKLQLSEMRQLGWKNTDLELLVLSACRTALGDPQAELGFAGLAVATGVKSVLGSLWYVSDYGTLGLMTEFYHHLGTVTIKAEALRQAQLAMLRGEVTVQGGELLTSRNSGISLPPELVIPMSNDFSHPYYWSGFTIVGSPW